MAIRQIFLKDSVAVLFILTSTDTVAVVQSVGP
jgi:hypothetical protein